MLRKIEKSLFTIIDPLLDPEVETGVDGRFFETL